MSSYKKKVYKCRYCNKGFIKEQFYKQHIKLHIGSNRPFSCEECGMKFLRKSHLSSHIDTHRIDMPYGCEVCGCKFKAKCTLNRHKLTYQDKCANLLLLECPECNKKYLRKANLSHHMKMVHRKVHDSTNIFPCDKCDKSFKTLGILKNHRNTHFSSSFRCFQCDKIFNSKLKLSRHHLEVHANEAKVVVKDQACEICQFKFPNEGFQSLHTEVPVYAHEFTCPVCFEQCQGKDCLENHAKIIHGKDQSLICHYCDKKFTKVHHLIKHVNRTHSQLPVDTDQTQNEIETNTNCKHCAVTFASTKILTKHLKMHENYRLGMCYFCESKFSTVSQLQLHIIRHFQAKRKKEFFV